MEEQSDVDLVQAVRNGSRQAFTELMRRHQQRIYWVARRITGNHADADDVTQETFLRAYLALGDFRGEAAFGTWLYRIAVNFALSNVRKTQIRGYLQQSPLLTRLIPQPERPDDQLEFHETESRLMHAVGSLPEKQRAVFVMRFFDELSYEEISQIVKTSVGGLKANYFHALRKVQEKMKDDDTGQE